MTYDQWAEQRARIRSDFDEYMTDVYGSEQTGISPKVFEMLLDAWNWSAVRTLEMSARVAENTYEGGCCGNDEGDSGYDFNGDKSAENLREIAEGVAASLPTQQENR